MKYATATALCCLFAFAAAKEKQIKLEDIERDNLASERNGKDGNSQLQQYKAGQYLPAKQSTTIRPKMQYGFVPIQSHLNYVPQYEDQNFGTATTPSQGYTGQTQAYLNQNPTNYHHQQQQQQQQQVTYVQAGGQQHVNQYVPQYYSQTYQQPEVQYYQQPYTNIQYIVDNQVQQTTQHQKYYTVPQYVYVQQYPSASNNIQAVADSKGNVQYVMYVPASYDNLVQPYTAQQQVYDEQPTVTEAPRKYTSVQYVPEKPKYTKIPTKTEPTSLLDSYVPSILQYQYYKQQENLNAIKQAQKISPVEAIGKGSLVKNYKISPDQGDGLQTSHTYISQQAVRH